MINQNQNTELNQINNGVVVVYDSKDALANGFYEENSPLIEVSNLAFDILKTEFLTILLAETDEDDSPQYRTYQETLPPEKYDKFLFDMLMDSQSFVFKDQTNIDKDSLPQMIKKLGYFPPIWVFVERKFHTL
ncbi:hypothetical protein M5U04_13900 [Xenorhabdus sp. XENO-1]|uniref:hypothetical protein n=1 Tax=Xenorhabdus bovienii TaxID=40576 RepID=UPI0020CA9191|nr:hypothetical protein [Xenorhabdus bovienii]MCP9269150.1 hypothetical protein [Xenorhabdus bovienii subsp. africana]